jgi:hypothetical protein
MSAALPTLPNRLSQPLDLPIETMPQLPTPYGVPLLRETDDEERGACGGLIDPVVGRAMRAEMSGFDDDDLADGDSLDEGIIEDDEDDLDDFEEIDEEDFDDDFDDDFEEELEDEYEIEIEDEISAEFGLGPDRDDEGLEELDDLDSLADDLDDLDSDDLKD